MLINLNSGLAVRRPYTGFKVVVENVASVYSCLKPAWFCDSSQRIMVRDNR